MFTELMEEKIAEEQAKTKRLIKIIVIGAVGIISAIIAIFIAL